MRKIETVFPGKIGLGTWKMGDSTAQRKRDADAVLRALRMGYRLIDTAEMYGSGGAEKAVGDALKQFGPAHRSELCIVSKVLPQNASRKGTVKACEASLTRLGCDYIDVYLLHWRGSYPLEATLEAFLDLQQRGLIRRYGVSNFDVVDLQEWQGVERRLQVQQAACINQVYYCLQARGIEFGLLPWQRQHDIVTMAYSPLGLGELAHHPLLAAIGAARGYTAAQIALAWVIRHEDVVAIPKSADPVRQEQNLRAADVVLTGEELLRLNEAFPPPRRKTDLEMV